CARVLYSGGWWDHYFDYW
nr:immunoglobulin heavy chain junction region [Macaca mulatta]